MNLEFFINNMLEKINRAEISLYAKNVILEEESKRIDKKGNNKI